VVEQDGGDSALVLPVLVLVARTLSPGFSWLMGTAMPVASRTLVPAAKLSPHELPTVSPASAPASSAAKDHAGEIIYEAELSSRSSLVLTRIYAVSAQFWHEVHPAEKY